MPEDRHSGTPGGNGSGADVKSGSFSAVDGDAGTTTFNTAFGSIPNVTATLNHSSAQAVDIIIVKTITTTSFGYRLHKGHGGSAHTWVIEWIATDAGDP